MTFFFILEKSVHNLFIFRNNKTPPFFRILRLKKRKNVLYLLAFLFPPLFSKSSPFFVLFCFVFSMEKKKKNVLLVLQLLLLLLVVRWYSSGVGIYFYISPCLVRWRHIRQSEGEPVHIRKKQKKRKMSLVLFCYVCIRVQSLLSFLRQCV